MEWCNFSRQEVFCSLIIERTVRATESDCNNFEDGRNETLIRSIRWMLSSKPCNQLNWWFL